MSYSRWSDSKWYTYWSTSSGPLKEDQILCLWYSMDMCKDWTYQQLKQMNIDDLMIEYGGVPYNDILEAQQYISAFINDVDNDYTVDSIAEKGYN